MLLILTARATPVITDESALSIRSAVYNARCRWMGCDWRTTFGPTGTDLMGLRSSQVRLLAEATSGTESATWDAAANWLKEVEKDAAHAEASAIKALKCAEQGDFQAALEFIRQSVAMESKYRTPIVWSPIQDLLQTLVFAQSAKIHQTQSDDPDTRTE